MNMQMTSFYYMTIGWKDFLNCITDDIITCNKDSLGGRIQFIFAFFIIFPYFLKFSSVLMNMQIR